jgi:hypothetical protein
MRTHCKLSLLGLSAAMAACSAAADDSSQTSQDLSVSLPAVAVPVPAPLALHIDRVVPATPVENRPVSLYFTITNQSTALHNGVVGANVRPATILQAPYGTNQWSIPSLAPGETATGVLVFPAPMAAANHTIDLFFQEGGPCDPDHPCTGTHAVDVTATLNTSARFRIAFEDIQIENTRAFDEDTDFASLSVQSDVLGYDQTQSLGDVDNGVHSVGLVTQPMELVPGLGNPIKMGYLVVNKGYPFNLAAFLGRLGDVIVKIADGLYPAGATYFNLIHDAINEGIPYLYPNCDGVVAADNFTIPTSELDSDTYFDDRHPMHIHYPGTDTHGGCGSNSQYDVDSAVLRDRQAVETLTLSPGFARVPAGGTVLVSSVFVASASSPSAPPPTIQWSVEGDPSAGWIEPQGSSAVFHAGQGLPLHGYVAVDATNQSTGYTARAYVALQPVAPIPVVIRW